MALHWSRILRLNKLRLSLRAFLMISWLLVLLLIIVISAWFSYRTAIRAAEQFEQQQSAAISRQIGEQVTAFFEVPRRVASFNIAQFGAGLIDPDNQERLVRSFLLQLRQQPLLTFLSMGTAQGEYFSASRPPLGYDRALRVLQVTKAEDRVLQIYRVDAYNRISKDFSIGNNYFDTRTRPWFQAAVAADRIKWYSAYRYIVRDAQGMYEALGVGVSAPVYDANQKFIGVLAADMALTQLSGYLQTQIAHTKGTAFVAESSGELLATSDGEPVYTLDKEKTLRLKVDASKNPVIRRAGEVLSGSVRQDGSSVFEVDEERYLFDWKSIQLPDGPRLVIGVVMPESQFAGPVETALHNMYYLAIAILLLSVLVTLLATDWLSRPLVSLSRWANRLAAGDWHAKPPLSTPIREVAQLSGALGHMAETLQRNIDDLEARVAGRTLELKQANQQLAELSAAKSEFFARISHELRSPLNTIIGFARMLGRGSDRLSIHDASRSIEKSGIRLLGLINELLDESRLVAGKLSLSPKPVLLQPWLDDLARTMTVDCAAKGNRFMLTQTGNPPKAVVIDDNRLRQVLDNLVSNANRHTQRGEIRLCCHVGDAGNNDAREGGAALVRLNFSVSDTGSGIAPADLQRIFQPFTRGSELLDEDHNNRSGFGLGLSISSELLRLMNSEIAVGSTLGVGSTFSFTLHCPLAEAGQIAAPAWVDNPPLEPDFPDLPPPPAVISRPIESRRQNNAQSTEASQNAGLALIVEDDPEQRQLLALLLEEEGFSVLQAGGGEVAAGLMRQHKVQHIITDQMMPDGDGWFVLRQAREYCPNAALVMLSAVSPMPPPDFSTELAFDAVLRKPADSQILLDTLHLLSPASIRGPLPISTAQWQALAQLARAGEVTAIEDWLAALDGEQPALRPVSRLVCYSLQSLDFVFLVSVAQGLARCAWKVATTLPRR